MKFSLLVLSTLTIGAIAVAPGKGEDENHNMSKDIPLTPDEKPQDAKNAAPSSTEPKPSPSPALDANAGSPTPTDEDILKQITGKLPLISGLFGR